MGPPDDRWVGGLRVGLSYAVADESELDPLDAELWFREPGVCGSCLAWRSETREGDEIATGTCRLRPELGRVPADLKKCDRYMQRGGFTYRPNDQPAPKRRRAKTLAILKRPSGVREEARRAEVRAPRAPVSRVSEANVPASEPALIRIERKERLPKPRGPAPKEIDLGTLKSVPVIRQAMVELVREELSKKHRELHPKFKGGAARVVPTEGSAVELPVDRLFSMLERLLVSLEELEGALGKLEEADESRKQLAQIRGSFTTFNVLFSYRDEGFIGT
ncbi:MAG: hypothetical protein HYV07_05595 [Deltaproteobacteria bacterium]|nr:hypothetical protein [Deltaproteobacteria bacterium]